MGPNQTYKLCMASVNVLVAQLCLTLCNLKDGGPPDYSVHGILQARTLEEVAIPFYRGSSQPTDWTWISTLQADSLQFEPPAKETINKMKSYGMRENICKWCDQQGLNFQNIQTTQKHKNNSIKKWAADLNRHFPKEEIKMANRHTKRCSYHKLSEKCTWKLQQGTTSHPSEWPSFNTNDKSCRGCREKGNVLRHWWEWNCTATLENSTQVPQETVIELEFDPAIPLLSIYPDKNMIWKDTRAHMFIIALFTIAKLWK